MLCIAETSRVVLREVSRSDSAFILELMNEPAYIENIGDRGIRTLDDAGRYIDAKYTANYSGLGYGLYLVKAKAGGAPIGICGFVKREVLECADIGFAYLEKYRSRGYGYESAEAVLRYGRDKLGFVRVFGVTSPKNKNSVGLLNKLGFDYDRIISLPGYVEDSYLFSKFLKPS